MNTRQKLKQEATFEWGTRNLVRSINSRLSRQPVVGELWVRVRPPSIAELDRDGERPTLVKFHRVGGLVMVAEVLAGFVEIVCAGESLMVGKREFLDTWLKIDEWPGKQSSSAISDLTMRVAIQQQE